MRKLILAGLAVAAVGAAPPGPRFLRRHAILGGEREPVRCFAFAPGGKILATGGGVHDKKTRRQVAGIALWDVASGKLRTTWETQRGVSNALGFSPDGKTLVSSSVSLERTHWEVASGRRERTLGAAGAAAAPGGLHFSADGKRVGVCGHRLSLVWEAATGREIARHERTIGDPGSILSHDLRLVAAPNHQDVDLWDVGTGKLVRSLLDHRGKVCSLSLSRDDRLLAVGCYRTTDDDEYVGEVRVWDVTRGKKKLAIGLGELVCRGVALAPAGDVLAVAGSLGLHGPAELRVFDLSFGGELARLRPRGVRWIGSLTFRPDGRMLAAACDNAVRLWTVQKPGGPGKAKSTPK
jgi:WD40 repeat protein